MKVITQLTKISRPSRKQMWSKRKTTSTNGNDPALEALVLRRNSRRGKK
jgi:hypothetical protein